VEIAWLRIEDKIRPSIAEELTIPPPEDRLAAMKSAKLAPARILAIVFLLKDRLDLLLTPYLISRSARSLQKSSISISICTGERGR
jgi:hypothetical protein